MYLTGTESNMQSTAPNRCMVHCYGSYLVVLGPMWWSDYDCQCLPEVPFIALFLKADEIHTHLGGSWCFLSEHCIWRRRPSILNSSWHHPWKHGRDFCMTWWMDGGDKYGGWKDGGWLCGVLVLPLLFCGGMSIRIGAGRFHCGDLYGGFCGTGVETWDWQVAFGIVFPDCGYWYLGVGILWYWGTLGYFYSHTFTSFLYPLSVFLLYIQWWY